MGLVKVSGKAYRVGRLVTQQKKDGSST